LKFHEILDRTAWRLPNNTFLFDGADSISYKEAKRITENIAGGLSSLNVQKGDRVAMCASNSMNYILGMFGIFRVGGIVSVISTRDANSLSYFIDDLKANILFYSSEINESVENNKEKMPSLKHYISLDDKTNNSIGMNELTSSKPLEKEIDLDELAPAHLAYTSGTSGKPRGCILSHYHTARTTNCIAERLLYNHTDTILSPTTLSSSFRLVASDLPGIHRGASIGLMKTWNPYLALDIINQKKATVLVGNPIILKDLLDTAISDGRACSSLRMVMSGGGPVYKSLKEGYQKYFSIPIAESCGQSELGGFFALGYPKLLYDETILAVGKPLPDRELKIVDDNDKEVPIGELGEVTIRGGVMLGYWQKRDETAYALRNGWLHTGDAGKMDINGYLYILGRMNQSIKSGKLNIFPRMIEESVSQLPSIRQVAVIGVPDKDLGEIPKAYLSLVPESKITKEQLREYFYKKLGKYAPKEIEIIDQMPMTATGKISKRQLKEREKNNIS
jgi:acyl-CoA synthetase (AMP-forming)/AMP-acid ligase II